MEVRAADVVVGATDVIAPPCIALRVGAIDFRAVSWFQPSPSSTRRTTCVASASSAGAHDGGAVRRPAIASKTLVRHPPSYSGRIGEGALTPRRRRAGLP